VPPATAWNRCAARVASGHGQAGTRARAARYTVGMRCLLLTLFAASRMNAAAQETSGVLRARALELVR